MSRQISDLPTVDNTRLAVSLVSRPILRYSLREDLQGDHQILSLSFLAEFLRVFSYFSHSDLGDPDPGNPELDKPDPGYPQMGILVSR